MFDISQARRLATMATNARLEQIELEEDTEYEFLREQEKDIMRLMMDEEYINFCFNWIDDRIQMASQQECRKISLKNSDAGFLVSFDSWQYKFLPLYFSSSIIDRRNKTNFDQTAAEELRGILTRFPWINIDDGDLICTIILATMEYHILPLYQESGYSVTPFEVSEDVRGFYLSW